MKKMDYTITSRPWWLSHAVKTERGIVVARADAVSSTRRKPTQADIESGIAYNQYDSSTACSGDFVPMVVDFTEEELSAMGLVVGVLDWPNVIDGTRPATNRTDTPVTDAESQRVMALLQSEGHCDDPAPVDHTPWQKGDDLE